MTRQETPERTWRPGADAISRAANRLKNVVVRTPMERDEDLSKEYEAEILLKREDLQVVRSYKIRGAYNKIRGCSKKELENGVSCASGGNHAQGVAFASKKLGIHATIYMPLTTPSQKIERDVHKCEDRQQLSERRTKLHARNGRCSRRNSNSA